MKISWKIWKPGRLKLIQNEDSQGAGLTTVPQSDPRRDQLQLVFRNGEVLIDQTFPEIRQRAQLA